MPEDRSNEASREAMRRVAEVKRFVALDGPTREDEIGHAAALGLSRQRFRQLVRAWRLHGDTEAERRLLSDPTRVAEAIAAADGPLDLTSVDEEKRAAVAERIRVFAAFLKSGRFDGVNTGLFAARYGSKPSAFRKAVRDWVRTPEPRSVPGASRFEVIKRTGRGLDPRVASLLTDTVGVLPKSANITVIHLALAKRCRTEGLPAPSIGWVRNRLAVSKSRDLPQTTVPALLLDRVAVYLPSPDVDRLRPAILTLIVTRPGGRIIGHSLDAAPSPAADALALLRALDDPGRAAPVAPLIMSIPSSDVWADLLAALRRSGVAVERTGGAFLRSGRLILSLIGDRLGALPIRRATKSILAESEMDGRPDPETRRMVTDAIEEHGRESGTAAPQIAEGVQRDDLMASLASMRRRVGCQ